MWSKPVCQGRLRHARALVRRVLEDEVSLFRYGVVVALNSDSDDAVSEKGVGWRQKRESRRQSKTRFSNSSQRLAASEASRLKSPVFLAATHSWWVTVKPVTTIDQRATSVYYEPEFKSVVQKYRQVLQSKDGDKLQEFVDERRELTIRRLNVSSHSMTSVLCSTHY